MGPILATGGVLGVVAGLELLVILFASRLPPPAEPVPEPQQRR